MIFAVLLSPFGAPFVVLVLSLLFSTTIYTHTDFLHLSSPTGAWIATVAEDLVEGEVVTEDSWGVYLTSKQHPKETDDRELLLYQFRRWGPWDAQRIGGKYRYEFVDYATVIIGLYAAAAGIPRDDILRIENLVANTSNFDKNAEFDKTYIHLPTINIKNTDIGYHLYRSGLVGAVDPKP